MKIYNFIVAGAAEGIFKWGGGGGGGGGKSMNI